MALVDFERAWLDLKRAIAGKPSHGAAGLLEVMARLELECEIDESTDQAVLRRFEGHLIDSFFGALPPRQIATDGPPAGADPLRTVSAVAEGATPDQPTEGDTPCPRTPQPPSARNREASSRSGEDFPPAGAHRHASLAAATT